VPATPYSDLRDLRHLLEELGIERCALVGCSAGGQIAIDFALEHPDVADAVVLVSTGLTGYEWQDPDLDEPFAEIERAVAEGDLERAIEAEIALWAPLGAGGETDPGIRSVAMDNTGVFRIPDTLVEVPASAVERLDGLQAATLVIVGDRDVAEIHRIADLLVKRVPGAHKHEIHDADHLVMARQPEVFNRLVLDFLSFRM
jgi:pimeloyl-ACP methyl ester carboxylesterase